MNINRLKIWYSGLTEVLGGYKRDKTITETIGVQESVLIELQHELRTIISNNAHETVLSEGFLKYTPIIALVLNDVLEHIPEWELPLRMDASKQEIQEEIRQLKVQ